MNILCVCVCTFNLFCVIADATRTQAVVDPFSRFREGIHQLAGGLNEAAVLEGSDTVRKCPEAQRRDGEAFGGSRSCSERGTWMETKHTHCFLGFSLLTKAKFLQIMNWNSTTDWASHKEYNKDRYATEIELLNKGLINS